MLSLLARMFSLFQRTTALRRSVNPGDAETLPLDEVKLLAPVVPSKVVCVGRNYREHAAELGNKMPDEPLLFLKAPSAVIAPGEEIELPSGFATGRA